MIEIHHRDCIEGMKELKEDSVDAVITDPPYGLEFMGRSWDSFKETGDSKSMGNVTLGFKGFKVLPRYNSNNYNYQKFSTEWAVEALRVLKPGGHLLSFGGTRTHHRMFCGIEDAGFDIRDEIVWLYGSGFPKSLNISKAVDKLQGNERELLGENPNNRPNAPLQLIYSKERIAPPLTKGTSEWEGYGTALKPAHEPICMARKPLSENSIADNVLKWRTGGINIDECRIQYVNDKDRIEGQSSRNLVTNNKHEYTLFNKLSDFDRSDRLDIIGRFPANVIHDGSDEVLACFPDTNSGKLKSDCYEKDRENNSMFAGGENFTHNGYDANSGNASRYFYCAKANPSERNAGCDRLEEKSVCINESHNSKGLEERYNMKSKNPHPTVKPVELMEYLVKLITPKGGTVLDPFMGSGSTGIACKRLGFGFIGFEKEKEYVDIAKARINGVITIDGWIK